jgi:hypothetical protein
MTQVRRNTTFFLILVVVLLLAASLYGLSQQLGEAAAYQDFKRQELQTIAQFDTLNMNVANNSIPPPPENSTEIERWPQGIDFPAYEHGRYLVIQIATTDTAPVISNYYRDLLLQQGWSEYVIRVPGINFYYHGTSCIRILHCLMARADCMK